MRILYLTYDVIDNEPIVKTQVVEMCRRISVHNCNISFDIVSLRADNVNNLNSYSKVENNISYFYSKKTNFFILDYFRFLLLSTRVCFKQNPEIIHVRSYIPMPIAIFLKIFFKKRVIFDMRGLLPEEHIYFNGKSKYSVFYLLLKSLEFVFVKLSDHIVVVSNNFREYLISRYKTMCDITVIYCSANQEVNNSENEEYRNLFYSKYNLDSSQILITYVGSFYKYQNIEKLFNIIKVACETYNLKFLLFTKTPRNEVYDMLERCDVNPNNVVVDYIDSNELGNYLRFCDYGIILRDRNIINKVASPIKVSEYISSNLKILYSGNIGDFNTLLKESGFGFEIGSCEDGEFILEKSLNSKYSHELRRLVSYEFNQEKYYSIYKRLLR